MPRFAEPVRAPAARKSASKPAAVRPPARRLAPAQQAALSRVLQRRAEGRAAAAPSAETPSRGDLPDRLKAGVEQLSGLAMDDVRVHRNSSEPAKLGALAYTKGSDIHLGPGQEQHLAHEAWHVVQQKQGRVRPTTQLKGDVPVNDDATLEREADAMGARALRQTAARPAGATPPAAPIRSRSAIQRKIVVAGAKVTPHDLAQHLGPLLDDRAKRLLKPIYDAWAKEKGPRPADPVASYQALRTALVETLVEGWIAALKGKLPKLHAFLPASQFNTLAFMTNLGGFDAKPLEQAFVAAQSSATVEAKTLAAAFSPGKLPHNGVVGYGIFAGVWAAQTPGVTGLIAELQVAAGIKSDEILKGQKVGLSINMHLGGKAIGGVNQTTQDADVSFTSKSGSNVLVEVAASIDRLLIKMGGGGDMQRKRYKRLVEVDANRVLAFATPGEPWFAFFTGAPSIADQLPGLDDIGWGLVIDGHYAAPDELTAMSVKLRTAEPKVSTFWKTLASSRQSYDDARKTASADQLQKGLQKYVQH